MIKEKIQLVQLRHGKLKYYMMICIHLIVKTHITLIPRDITTKESFHTCNCRVMYKDYNGYHGSGGGGVTAIACHSKTGRVVEALDNGTCVVASHE